MKIIYTHEPTDYYDGIFLAGPTPRSTMVRSWRPEAVELFEKYNFSGSLFIPEKRPDAELILDTTFHIPKIIEWEESGLTTARCIMFWIPREMDTMPALTTNIEWGRWYESGKVVLGAPKTATATGYIRYYANKCGVPSAYTIEDTVKLALQMYNKSWE